MFWGLGLSKGPRIVSRMILLPAIKKCPILSDKNTGTIQ